MKLNEEFLKKQTMTAQVRFLTLELLSDKKPHNRKEIVEYIREKEEEFHLEHMTPGCISGGIYQAVNIKECEKVGKATYVLKGAENDDFDLDQNAENENLSNRAADLIEEFCEKLAVASRSVDFVNANDLDCEVLNLMRQSIKELKKRAEEFRKIGKETR